MKIKYKKAAPVKIQKHSTMNVLSVAKCIFLKLKSFNLVEFLKNMKRAEQLLFYFLVIIVQILST